MVLQKKQIETILKINGVNPTAPDEEIRSVLLSARYNDDEIDTAIMVLRENVNTKESHVDGLHKVFRTNETLKSQEISSLLGIDVEIDDLPYFTEKPKEVHWNVRVFFVTLTIVVAIVGVFIAMYVKEVGIFFPSSSN